MLQFFTIQSSESMLEGNLESIVFEGGHQYFIKLKHQSFLSSSNEKTQPSINSQLIPTPIPERETIKHTLIGSTKAVTGTIRVLHQVGYANISDWSPLLPSPNPGEVMSILIRTITVQ